MTVYFRKSRARWVYHFEKDGKRFTGYCVDALGLPVKSRSAARQAEGVERRRLDLEPKTAKPGELTFAMAIAALTPTWSAQASWYARKIWLRDIIDFFGLDAAIGAVDQAMVDDYVTRCRSAKVKVWRGGPDRDPLDDRFADLWTQTDKARSPATVNLYLGTLRQIFARAGTHRDPRTGAPVFAWLPTVPEIRRDKRRARPMPDQVAAEVMSIMPAHIVDAMMLTALFGFRKGEAFSLTRNHVDWDSRGIRLQAEDVKDAEDIFLPASQFALGFLWCLDIDAEARGITNLVSWQPKKGGPFVALAKPGHAWDRAQAFMLAKYGKTWRWHDLRAAYITKVALTSGPQAAQILARHSDQETTQGYIEVADELRRLAADRIGDQLQASNENRRQDPQTAEFAAKQGRKKPL